MYQHITIKRAKVAASNVRAQDQEVFVAEAAPDLYRALNEVAHMVSVNLNPAVAGDGKAMERAMAALAKARGLQ